MVTAAVGQPSVTEVVPTVPDLPGLAAAPEELEDTKPPEPGDGRRWAWSFTPVRAFWVAVLLPTALLYSSILVFAFTGRVVRFGWGLTLGCAGEEWYDWGPTGLSLVGSDPQPLPGWWWGRLFAVWVGEPFRVCAPSLVYSYEGWCPGPALGALGFTGCFDNTPYLTGVGRWLGLTGLYRLNQVKVVIATGPWVIAYPIYMSVAAMSVVVVVFFCAKLFRRWGAWVFLGDPVGNPDYQARIAELAEVEHLDVELLAYCVRGALSRPRDTKLLQTLQQSASAWAGVKRKQWNELETTVQVAGCSSTAFAFTDIERRNRVVWAGAAVLRGIYSATAFASGKLAWGRELPAP